MIRFGILGPLEVVRGRRHIPIPAAKQRIALASLLLHADRQVGVDQLIEHLWQHDAPENARAALQTHIARLRRVIEDGLDGERLIQTREHGYLLAIGTAELDVLRFRELVAASERMRRTKDDAAEAALLGEALALWRGPALADVLSEPLQRDHGARLAEERLSALERWSDLGLALGREEEIVAELAAATAAHPLRERLWALRMRALCRCGRQAEALEAYHDLAELLREELGVDPGKELRLLHQAILSGDPALTPTERPAHPVATQSPPGSTPAGGQDAAAMPYPRQLPSDIAAFTGRADHLAALDRLLRKEPGSGAGRAAAPIRIAVISGSAGVGKTALAVHWAHRGAHADFPDGQLYLNLRGFGPGDPVETSAALEMLLHGLGFPAERIPAQLEARSALLRSLLAGGRMLMLLDNAKDAAQVRPLLPGSDCMVLITSRNELRGLSVDGDTVHLTLGVFTPQESQELLSAVAERTRAEPAATAELGELCAHLPLALRIAVANLRPGHYARVADYVAELREGNRLAALQIDGDEETAVRGTLDLSYAALPPRTRTVFRLLGLVPGPDFTPEAAAALSGLSASQARQELNRLADAHLVHRLAPGRYGFHDLLRLYAAERAHAEEDVEDEEEARQRLYDWYLLSACTAVGRLHPHWIRMPMPPSGTAVTPVAFDDRAAASAWLNDEHANLVTAINQAAEIGPRPMAWLLTDAMRSHFWTGRRMSDWLSCASTARDAADEEGDLTAMAAARISMADVHAHQEEYEQAISLHTQAASLAQRAGWREGEVSSLGNIAHTYWRLGRPKEAVRYLEDSMTLLRQYSPPEKLGAKHTNLGVVHLQLGHLDSAHDHLVQALKISADDPSATLCNLASVCRLLGRFDDAQEHLGRVWSLLQEAGDHAVESCYLVTTSELHLDLGRHDQALEFAGRTLTLGREVGDRVTQQQALNALGGVHESAGRYAESMEQYRAAAELAGDDNLFSKAEALIGLTRAAAGLGDAGAAAHAERALEIARERSFLVLEGLALSALADLALADGDRDRAVQHAEPALKIHRDTGYRLAEARTLRTLGHATGDAMYVQRALKLFTEIGSPEAEAF